MRKAIMNKLDDIKIKISETIKSHTKYNFPEFLAKLRKDLCVSRKTMADDLKIPYLRLFHFELGEFTRPIGGEVLKSLSVYFGIPEKILSEKAQSYKRRRLGP
jgi:hypothetical protein